MEQVTQHQLQSLRDTFFEKVSNQNPDFCAKDLDRVKTNDNWLKRFLAHYDYRVDTAAKMLYETCTWRKENGINDLTHHDVLPALLESGLYCIRNQDRWGKKMSIFKMIRYKKGQWPLEEHKKGLLYYLERLERASNSDQVTFMGDAENCGMSNCDLDYNRYFADLLNTHYPFFVNYSITYELPWYLGAIFKLTKAFMPQKTAERLVLAYKTDIDNYIDEDNRLVEWGGRDNYKFQFEPEIEITSPALDQSIEDEDENENQSENDDSGTDIEKLKDLEDLHSEPSTVSIKTLKPDDDFDSGDLIQVPEQVVFTKNGAGGIGGRFQFKNVSSNDTLIFKVKTTAPEKFHVRPTLGLLEKTAVGTVTITIQAESHVESVQKERFQIQVAPAPKNLLNGLQSNKKELSDEIGKIWKTILNKETQVETHLIKCSLDPATVTPNGGIKNMSHNLTLRNSNSNSKQPLSNEDEVFKRLREIENQMEKMKADFLTKLAFGEKLMYILLGMMIFLFICLLRSGSNQNETNTSQKYCTME